MCCTRPVWAPASVAAAASTSGGGGTGDGDDRLASQQRWRCAEKCQSCPSACTTHQEGVLAAAWQCRGAEEVPVQRNELARLIHSEGGCLRLTIVRKQDKNGSQGPLPRQRRPAWCVGAGHSSAVHEVDVGVRLREKRGAAAEIGIGWGRQIAQWAKCFARHSTRVQSPGQLPVQVAAPCTAAYFKCATVAGWQCGCVVHLGLKRVWGAEGKQNAPGSTPAPDRLPPAAATRGSPRRRRRSLRHPPHHPAHG